MIIDSNLPCFLYIETTPFEIEKISNTKKINNTNKRFFSQSIITTNSLWDWKKELDNKYRWTKK